MSATLQAVVMIIIHKEKTRKITAVTVVWISDTNYHKILRTLSLNFSKKYCSLEKLYRKLYSVFHPISRHLEVGLKKLGCASFFNPLLGVWLSDETLLVVFDISYFNSTKSIRPNMNGHKVQKILLKGEILNENIQILPPQLPPVLEERKRGLIRLITKMR